MSRSNAPVLVLLVATLVATLFVAGNLPSAGDGEATDGSADARLAAIEERLARIERALEDVRDEARRATRATPARRVNAVDPESGDAADVPDAAAATLPPEELERVVAENIRRTVEDQMERMAAEKRNRGADGKWKPPLDEMGRTLDLSETQSETLRGIFDGARDETFDLLRTQRRDGTSLLDDFVRDLRDMDEPKAAWKRFFEGISTQQVPGRNQTYLEALGDAEKRIRGRIRANLDDEQTRRFDSLNVDVFDVKTGHDPVGDYVRRRLGE